MSNACRNPLQLMAVVVLGLVQSFLLVMLFGGVGDDKINSLIALGNSESIIFNWLGMVFLASSDQFIICAFAMVLMIPLAFPVFQREMGSHMYSATSYYIAATLSNICINIFYPLLVSLLTFFFYGFPISNFEGFMCFFLIETTAALAGICFGQVIGSCVTTEYNALMTLLQTLTLYYLGSGMLVNAASANWFGMFLMWVSPLRYVNELSFRRMLAGRNEIINEIILEQLGFTWGVTTCSVAIFIYMVVCLGLGWFLMYYLSRGR